MSGPAVSSEARCHPPLRRPRSGPPPSGHAARQSLEIYSRLALADAQRCRDDAIGHFPA
jgi:hypothetical protein